MSQQFLHGRKGGSIETPIPALPFQIGDLVHEIDETELGRVEFIRRDGNCCLIWPSGKREWLHSSVLCGPIVQ